MIKITNGCLTIEVTKGAYDTFYSEQGFEVIDKEKNENGNDEENDD